MPKSSKAPKKFSLKGKKKQVITAVVIILVLAAAAATGFLLQMWQRQSDTNPTNKGGALNIGIDDKYKDSTPQNIQDAQNLATTGNVEQSNKDIAEGIANATSNDDKYELYMQQGVNAENQKKYDDAIASYKNALALKKTWTIYSNLGRASAAKGDKTAAINYYNQAIPLLDKSTPLYSVNLGQIQSQIKALGG